VRTIPVNPAPAAAPPGGLPAGAPPQATGEASQELKNRVAFEIMAGTVVTILNDASKSVQEAAEQALSFLETGAPVMLDQILQMNKMGGVDGVLNTLAGMPVLNAIPAHPRGREFVTIFLREAQLPPAAVN
jgi:hypothetical protein